MVPVMAGAFSPQGPHPARRASRPVGSSIMPEDLQHRRSSTLVDVLDRVLDKGLVVAGDIKVSLAEVELLTIRIRLLICSLDKAEQIGLDWWKHDRHLTGTGLALAEENNRLRERLRALEQQRLTGNGAGALKKRSPAADRPTVKRARRRK
jgi:hypothetical protein